MFEDELTDDNLVDLCIIVWLINSLKDKEELRKSNPKMEQLYLENCERLGFDPKNFPTEDWELLFKFFNQSETYKAFDKAMRDSTETDDPNFGLPLK